MKKIFSLFIIGIILLGVTVFAQDLNTDKKAQDFVKEVAQKKGIEEDKISGVKELNLNELPEEVNIKNVDTTNLALYQIDVDNEENPVYVVTASSKFFKETLKKYSQRMLLTFGLAGEAQDSTFLKTSVGVTTDLQKGYVMTRDGAISGLSTNIEIVEKSSPQPIEITIYKNSEKVGFKNEFYETEPGIYVDYDQANGGILSFERGDVISLEINVPENTKVKDITSLLEIETN